MTKITAILLIIFSLGLPAFSQETKGSIYDSTGQKKIERAVIALLTPVDSMLYRFTRTSTEGKFSMNQVKPGKYILMITHPYYADYVDDIEVGESGLNLSTIFITPKSKILQEVVLKTGAPIRIKGDTVTYTADSFKVSANANVEELLRKLPGIQVDKKGEIKAMGQKVEKVLVDGEEFFGDDPGMAVKNLRADAVKEVQVFDKKSEQAEFTGIDDGNTKKTINLKLKEDRKKGYFGKIEVSGGLLPKNGDRYNNNIMLSSFKGKRKLSGYLLQGNTGQNGMNWQDMQKYGGDDDNVTMDMGDDGGFVSIWRGGNDEDPYIDTRNGFFENLNTGIQYTNKWNEKHTLNFSPKFNRQEYHNRKNTFTQFQLGDIVFNDNATENTYSKKWNSKNNLTYDWKIDSMNTLKVTTKLNIYNTESSVSKQSGNTNGKGLYNNKSISSTNNNIDKTSFTNTILFNHKFRKARRTFSFSNELSLLDSKSTGYLDAVNDYFDNGILNRSDTIDQQKKNDNLNQKWTAKAVYTEPLSSKYSLEISHEFTLKRADNDLSTLSRNKTTGKFEVPVDSLSNNFKQQITTNKSGIKLSFKFKKYKYSLGAAAGFTEFNLKDITAAKDYTRNFTNLFPTANFQYSYKSNHSLGFSYSGKTIQPTINQLQQLRNNNNPLNEYIGNPLLKQSFKQDFNINHNSYNFMKETWHYESVSMSVTNNAITNSTRIDASGKTISQPVNTDGTYSVNSWMGMGKKLRKLDMNLFLSLQYNHTGFREIVNGLNNKTSNDNSTLGINLSKSKEKKYEFNFSNDFGYNVNRSSVYNKTLRFTTNTIGFNGTVYYRKKWSLNSDFEFNYRQKTSEFDKNVNNSLWNAMLQRTFRNDEFTVYFTVRDILNQNIGIDRNFYSNTLTETRNDRLQRFWLVGFRWDFKNRNPAAK